MIRTIRNVGITGLAIGLLLWASNWMYSTSVENQLRVILAERASDILVPNGEWDVGALRYNYFQQSLTIEDFALAQDTSHAIRFKKLVYRGSLSTLTDMLTAEFAEDLTGSFELDIDQLALEERLEGFIYQLNVEQAHCSIEHLAAHLRPEGWDSAYVPHSAKLEFRDLEFLKIVRYIPESIWSQVVHIDHWQQEANFGSEEINLHLDTENYYLIEKTSDSPDSTVVGWQSLKAQARHHTGDALNLSVFPFHDMNQALHIFPMYGFPEGDAYERSIAVDDLSLRLTQDQEDDFVWAYVVNPVQHLDLTSDHRYRDSTLQVNQSFSAPGYGNYSMTFTAEAPTDASQFALDAYHEIMEIQFQATDLAPATIFNLKKMDIDFSSPQLDGLSFDGNMTWGQYGELFHLIRRKDSL